MLRYHSTGFAFTKATNHKTKLVRPIMHQPIIEELRDIPFKSRARHVNIIVLHVGGTAPIIEG